MSYTYIDYEITQIGRELSCDSTIKLQKYENKITRLIFNLEDWLKKNSRLYVAFLNPETKRYHYEPVLVDIDENYHVIIGTSVTYYPSKHKMVLLGVSPEYELDDNITLDTSNTVYISKEFNKIVVIDNFLSDEAFQISMPNIDYALDNFMTLYNNMIEFSVQTSDDVTECKDYKESCVESMVQCDEDLGTTQELAQQCAEDLENCYNSVNSCAESVTECENAESNCNDILAQCQTILTNCQALLAQSNSILTNMNNLNTSMRSQYETYMSNLQNAYNTYLSSIQRGGEP